VVPYPEDDTVSLAEQLGGTEALVMGSDWPHAEGLREPAEMYLRVEGLGEQRRRHFLRDNGLDLLKA
jgi:predicted TIM-barrel fold metal-dependent hydrolase